MSPYLRRVAPLLTGALVLAGAPLLASSPASAVPTLPGVGCVVNAVQSVASTGGAQSIPDLGTAVTKTIPVADSGALEWLRVKTDLTHSRVGDLLVTLTSPAGSVLTLTSNNGGTSANSFNGTWWDDQAGLTNPPGSVAEAALASGPQTTLAPEEGLAGLRGENVNGNWVLSVTDQAINGSSGSLAGWTLEYATRSGAAPDVSDTGTGTLQGGAIPALGHQTFTYPFGDVTGTVRGVTTRFDITGATQDVKATLTDPTGNVVTLTNANPSGPFSSFAGGLTLTDAAGVVPGLGPIADQLVAFLFGGIKTVTPQEPLSLLNGDAASGLWTLDIWSLGGPLTLNSWGLDLTSSTCGLDGAITPLTQLPTSLPLGSTVAYAVSVTNNRLAPLDLSTLKLVLPNGLDLVSVTSTIGSCAGLSCALGTLLPGTQAVVVYLLKAVTDGVKNVSVLLTSGGTDALPLNNVLNIATTVPAGSGPGASVKDTTAPGLVLVLGKDKLRTVTTKGLLAAAGWTEAGKLVLTVKLPGKVAKKLKLPRVIGKRTVVTSKAGTAKIRVKITKKAARKLLKAHKKVRLVLKGQLRDAAGNLGKASAGGTYKP